MIRFVILLAALDLAAPAAAANLSVRVVDQAGRPVRNAVVTVEGTGTAPHAASSGRYLMSQRALAFDPYVLVVPVGATVAFPNFDSTRHHVYSFSAAKRFELKLFAKDQTRSVTFDRPGVVSLGCNIHDTMSAFIYVAPSGWVARTDQRGMAVIANVGGGPGKVTVWHPYLRAPGGMASTPLGAGQRAATMSVRLRPPPIAMNQGY